MTYYKFIKYMGNIGNVLKLESGEELETEKEIPITGKVAEHIMKRLGKGIKL